MNLPLILLILIPCTAAADEGLQSAQTTPLTIRRINITSKNVFDLSIPGENIWLFRLTNKLHLVTRPSVVRREILLGPGSTWNPLLAAESERNLRSYNFFKSAEIEPVPVPGTSKLDLHVRTQDTWTLSPWFGFGSSGGKHRYTTGIMERNILGYGKTLIFSHSKNEDKVSNEIRYLDPRFLGSRIKAKSIYADTDTGQEYGAVIESPFFSLSTLYSFTVSFGRVTADRWRYSWGEEVDGFHQDHRFFEAGSALKIDSALDRTHRLMLCYLYRKDGFSHFYTAPGVTSDPFPSPRVLIGPYLSYQFIKSDFLEEININKMGFVEDFDLGPQIEIGAGYAPKAMGSSRDWIPFNGSLRFGKRLFPGCFSTFQAGVTGRTGAGELKNTIYFANANVYKKLHFLRPQTWALHVEAATAKNLDRENQIQLGGRRGLRGFKIREFNGNKAIMANLEARVFDPAEVFHLIHVGGALFVDAGRAWPQGQSLSVRDLAMDIGISLRMSPSRTSSKMVGTIDFAYACRSPNRPKGWMVSVAGTLAFWPSNNSVNHILSGPASNIREESEELKIRTRQE